MKHVQARASPSKNIIAGKWFCLFSVQAGVVIFSSMGCAVMLIVALLNLGGEENPEAVENRDTYYAILYCYTLPMLISFSLLYIGANKPDVNLLIIGLAIQFAFGVYWISITALSFIDDPKYVYSICIDNRCPETLWLYNTEWRTYGNECIVHVDDLLAAPPEDIESNTTRQKTKESDELLTEIRGGNIKENPDGILNETVFQNLPTHGGRSLQVNNSSQNDSNRYVQYSKQNNLTALVSTKYNGVHYSDSAQEHNRTYEYDGYLRNGEIVTLLPGQNNSLGTTRVVRLADDANDFEAILQDLLQLLRKKPFANLNDADKLRAVLYVSRVLGCTENIGNSMAKSVVGAVAWFAFLVYGNWGALKLIIELRQMIASGSLQQALQN